LTQKYRFLEVTMTNSTKRDFIPFKRLFLPTLSIILVIHLISFAQQAPRISASNSSSPTQIFVRPKITDISKRPVATKRLDLPKVEVKIVKPPLKVEKPEMIALNGGDFQMGVKDSQSDDGPSHLTSVPSFEISKYPITNKQFAQFVSETNYVTSAETQPTPYEKQNKVSWKTFSGAGRENFPVIWITYEDSLAYCVWLSSVVKNEPIREKIDVESEDEDTPPTYLEKIHPYRLPTEAEWEYAAKGGLNDNPFPWADPNQANINFNSNNKRENTILDAKQFIKPVGYQPPNNFGVQDLVGNVAQWCYDWYDPNFYEVSPHPPLKAYGPEKGEGRVIRGGSWLENIDSCKVTSRQFAPQSTRTSQVGFRIVRVIAPPKQTSSSLEKKLPSKQRVFCNFNSSSFAYYHPYMSLNSLVLLDRRRYFEMNKESH
jgi:formylglycine-generating enzyme required for sulfatase activity